MAQQTKRNIGIRKEILLSFIILNVIALGIIAVTAIIFNNIVGNSITGATAEILENNQTQFAIILVTLWEIIFC